MHVNQKPLALTRKNSSIRGMQIARIGFSLGGVMTRTVKITWHVE
jgi:hypothetical protein